MQRTPGATRTASGDIAMASQDSPEVLVFDAAGTLRKTYRAASDGRTFVNVRLSGRAADSIVVFEPATAQLSVFNAREGALRTRVVPAPHGERLEPIARFSNGDILLQSALPALSHDYSGAARDSFRVAVLRANTDSINTVRTFPSSANVLLRVWGNLLWIGNHETNELTLVDKSGKITSRMAVSHSDDEDVTVGPTFENFFVAPEGLIWIERASRRDDAYSRWIVMQRNGSIVAQAIIPLTFDPVEIGTDYILGIKRNRDGRETVAMYRIWK